MTLKLFLASLILTTPLPAQTITGSWQATLPIPPNPPRTLLKIFKSPDGALRATRYQVDKNPDGLPFTTVTFTAPDLTLDQSFANFDFHGKLSPDGKSITGIWTQQVGPEKKSFPVTFDLATPETLWKPSAPARLPPMSPTADPAFELATIKLAPPGAKFSSYQNRTHNFAATNQSVQELIKFAWNLRDRQIQGGPDWFTEVKYDIAAEPDTPGQPSVDQNRLMLRKLLADRFQLQSHTIQQIVPVYALTRDKTFPPLTPGDPEFAVGNIWVKDLPSDRTQVHFLGNTIPMFADLLMNFIPDRQVIDETGLTGHFDFDLTIPSTTLREQGADSVDEKANAFIHAVQPLGFRLIPKKAPIDILVVDRLEKPTPN